MDETVFLVDSQMNMNNAKMVMTKDRPLIDDIQSNLFALTEDISLGKRKGKLKLFIRNQ